MTSTASTTRQPRRRLPSPAAVAGYGALVVAAGALGVMAAAGTPLLGASGRAGIIAGVALVVLAAAPTLRRLRLDFLDAPGLYAFATVFFFGVTSLAWLGTPYGPGPGLTRHDVARALLVVALGVASFGAGARMIAPPRRMNAFALDRVHAPTRTALLNAYAVALVGVVASLVLHVYGFIASPTASAQLSGVLEGLNFLGALGGLVVLVTALTFFATNDRTLRTPLIAFIVIQTVFGVVSGVKGTTVEGVVFVLLALMACGRRVPWKATVALVVTTLLVLVPINTVYRDALRNSEATTSAALSQAINSPSTPTTSPTSPFTVVFTRFRSIDDVALIVSQTPSLYPFANGSSYYELPAIAVVPRIIWPSKPVLTGASDFSHTYWQVPPGIRTSTPLTQVGDLYRNFKLTGVVLGMFLWGIVIGVWQRARRRWNSPVFGAVYLYSALSYVTYVESDLPELFATAVKILPLVTLVAWLLLPGRGGEPGYRKLIGTVSRPPADRRPTPIRDVI